MFWNYRFNILVTLSPTFLLEFNIIVFCILVPAMLAIFSVGELENYANAGTWSFKHIHLFIYFHSPGIFDFGKWRSPH